MYSLSRNRIGLLALLVCMFVAVIVYILSNSNQDDGFSKNVTPDLAKQKAYQLQNKKLASALKSYFEAAIAEGDIVGAGVSIVYSDSVLVTSGFGKRSIDTNTKVDGNTIFRLGSLSKGFAGVLAADLEAEGKISFDDRVTDYLPEFQLGDKINTNKVKISHILSHSSGAPYHSFTNLVEANLDMSKISSRFHEVKVQSEPNQQYSYQNAIFALSQEVFRKATGNSVKTLLKNRILAPLGMAKTSLNHADLIKEKNVALPHVKRTKGWKSIPLKDRYYNAVVAGGVNSNSKDMAKWMQFLLGRNPDVLDSLIIQKAFLPRIEIEFNNKYYQRWPGYLKSHYGFGWRIHQFQENENNPIETIWHHGGSVNNYRNEIALFPDSDIGICVLLNGNTRFAQNVIPDVYDIVKKILE